MVLSNFLSRQKKDDSNPHKIIPISFNMYRIINDNDYNIEKFYVQTRSQTKSSGIKLPKVHGMRKNLDPNVKPEKQAIPKQGSVERPHTGQEGAGLGRKRPDPINQSIKHPSDLLQKIPGRTEIETRKTNPVHSGDLTHSISNMKGKITNNNPLIPDVLFHPGPVYRPPHKPIRHDTSTRGSQSSPGIEDINPNINFDFEENSPFQEGVISEMFQRLDKSFL